MWPDRGSSRFGGLTKWPPNWLFNILPLALFDPDWTPLLGNNGSNIPPPRNYTYIHTHITYIKGSQGSGSDSESADCFIPRSFDKQVDSSNNFSRESWAT